MGWEQEYLDLCKRVIDDGYRADSRAGATRSLPGCTLKIPLDDGFPLLTTRKMYPDGVIGELAGFVRGAEDLATYEKFGCKYWHDNAAEWSENKGKPESEWRIGRVYGTQWVDWRVPTARAQPTPMLREGIPVTTYKEIGEFAPINQIANVIDGIKKDPLGRRHIVTAWNPAELDLGVLPPCHLICQFYVREGGLHCCVYMRSVDLCVGLPSDIVLYALLTELIAKDTGLIPKSLTFFLGDAHVYENHVMTFNQQLGRQVLESPTLTIRDGAGVLDFVPEDVHINEYLHHDPVKYQFNK